MDVNIAGRTLISDINLTIHSGDKIVILWPNWSGKTTFIKQLLSSLRPQGIPLGAREERPEGSTLGVDPKGGGFEWKLTRSYIDQHNSQISGNIKVIDWYISKCPWHMSDHVAIRQLMDAGFTHWQMQQTIDTSSHWQKLKLTLLTSIKSALDILILDEPTNHLDIVTIQAVERMIAQYSWSVIMISHDPYFIANCEIDTIYRIYDKSLHKETL
jgi:ATPase subunit of ABC transporter with duplicated ATPase domains